MIPHVCQFMVLTTILFLSKTTILFCVRNEYYTISNNFETFYQYKLVQEYSVPTFEQTKHSHWSKFGNSVWATHAFAWVDYHFYCCREREREGERERERDLGAMLNFFQKLIKMWNLVTIF